MKRQILTIALLIIELIFTFQFAARTVSILQTNARIDSRRVERDLLKGQFQSKSRQFIYVDTDLYVEEIAREKLHYGHDGETTYLIPANKRISVDLPNISLTSTSSISSFGEILNWYELFFGH